VGRHARWSPAADIVPVSDGGGFAPRWGGDGKELLYLKADGSVMSVEMKTVAGATPGPAKRLFPIRWLGAATHAARVAPDYPRLTPRLSGRCNLPAHHLQKVFRIALTMQLDT
jgi:hypothetical protein